MIGRMLVKKGGASEFEVDPHCRSNIQRHKLDKRRAAGVLRSLFFFLMLRGPIVLSANVTFGKTAISGLKIVNSSSCAMLAPYWYH